MQTIDLLPTAEHQQNELKPAGPSRHTKAEFAALSKLLVYFIVAAVIGWATAWAIHEAYYWMLTSPPSSAGLISDSLRRVMDHVRATLY